MRYVCPFCCHAMCHTFLKKDAETMRMGTFADICCPIFKNFSTLITPCISIFYNLFFAIFRNAK